MNVTDLVKASVYRAWKNGQSKASLALENEVSPRTIGRWIEEIEATTPLAAPVIQAVVTEAPKEGQDTRYREALKLSNDGVSRQDIAAQMGVSVRTVGRWIEKAQAEKDRYQSAASDSLGKGKTVVSEKQDKVEYRHVASSRSVSITQLTNGKVTGSVTVDKGADRFEEIFDALLAANFSAESVAEAFVLLQPTKALEKFTHGKLEIDPKNRRILYVADEETVPYEVHNSLTDRVINMVREGQAGVETLINFLEKLMENPSRRAVNELYGFLDHNDIEIAPNGNFYAWKKVRSDYLDIYSGTMDNSVGKTLKVARNMVDEDSSQTCSYGLHVCAKHYLPSFGGASGNRILKVEVNPADVVAVPADYKNAKMRTTGYVVLEDVTSQF